MKHKRLLETLIAGTVIFGISCCRPVDLGTGRNNGNEMERIKEEGFIGKYRRLRKSHESKGRYAEEEYILNKEDNYV